MLNFNRNMMMGGDSMNYNLELKKLINEAKMNGYEFVDGEFRDIKKEEFIKCIYVRCGSIGAGESLGELEIFDKIYVLSDDEYNSLIKPMDEDTALDECINKIEEFDDEDWFDCDAIETSISCGKIYFYNDNEEKTESGAAKFKKQIYISYLDAYYLSIKVGKIKSETFNKHKSLYCLSREV